jgi:hypothetical protein
MSVDSTRPTGDQLVLAVVAAAATLLVVPVIVVAGDFSLWMAPAAAIAAGFVFARHDSSHGLAALGIVALLWLAARPDALSPWTVVVALLMFTIHTCLALRSTAPPGATLGRVVVTRWLRRSALVAVLTLLVYVAAISLRNLHRSDAEVVLASALALLGGLILLLRQETLESERPGGHDPP